MNDIKSIKTAGHHWFPQSLSKLWFNDDGIIYQLFSDGNLIPQNNTKNFGKITNAHTVKISKEPTVWDKSFENIFSKADDQFPHVIQQLQKHLSSCDINHEMRPLIFDAQLIEKIKECVWSLLVRSPQYKHSFELFINNIRPDITNNKLETKKLINANVLHTSEAARSIFKSGKLIILRSIEKEFIFGDGFYNNICGAALIPYDTKMIVPITPRICIMHINPNKYFGYPAALLLDLNKEEANFINETTLIYSKNQCFYSNEEPNSTENFKSGKFMEYTYHKNEWIESLVHSASNYRS